MEQSLLKQGEQGTYKLLNWPKGDQRYLKTYLSNIRGLKYEADIMKHEQKIQKSKGRNNSSYMTIGLGYQVVDPELATRNNKLSGWRMKKETKIEWE